jgi:hypothetical protein
MGPATDRCEKTTALVRLLWRLAFGRRRIAKLPAAAAVFSADGSVMVAVRNYTRTNER